jgi:hypothetical protein
MRRSTPPGKAVAEAEQRQLPVFEMDGNEIRRAFEGARKLGNDDAPKTLAFALTRVQRALFDSLKELDEKIEAVRIKHGIKVAGTRDPEKAQAASQEIKDLMAVKHPIAVKPIPSGMFDDLDISANALMDLGPLLEDTE